jgi:hypothetical protein
MKRIGKHFLILCTLTTLAFAQHGRPASVGPSGPSGHPSFGSKANPHTVSASGSQGKSMTDLLNQNTKLASQIHTLTGLDAQQACSGFKNLGQCVATAHVSQNLHISFDCLRADVTGQAPTSNSCPTGTGSRSTSLGQAIQTLSPNSDTKAELKKANKQAQHDIKESDSKS